MLQGDRKPDQDFSDPEERLYRRFPPAKYEDGDLELDVIELPDVSTLRSRYAAKPEWALYDTVGGGDYRDWGVAAIRIRDIPQACRGSGVYEYRFKPVHMPEQRNYPHTEVQGFDADGKHVSRRQDFPVEVQMKFREKMLWHHWVVVKPDPTAKPPDARKG